MDLINSIGWIPLIIGVVAIVLVLEMLLRTLFTRFGTPVDSPYPHRVGTELPHRPHS